MLPFLTTPPPLPPACATSPQPHASATSACDRRTLLPHCSPTVARNRPLTRHAAQTKHERRCRASEYRCGVQVITVTSFEAAPPNAACNRRQSHAHKLRRRLHLLHRVDCGGARLPLPVSSSASLPRSDLSHAPRCQARVPLPPSNFGNSRRWFHFRAHAARAARFAHLSSRVTVGAAGSSSAARQVGVSFRIIILSDALPRQC